MTDKKTILIDTHAHLDDERYDKDRDEVIKRAKEAGIEYIITVGCLRDKNDLERAVGLSVKYDFIRPAFGIHPHDAKDVSEDSLNTLRETAIKCDVAAIGETGLDYHYEHSPKDIQKNLFVKQINIARELKLPLIIHSREAQNDTLDIMQKENVRDIGGVLHCFSGSYEMAKKCLDMGMHLSFTGVVTFPKAVNIHEVVKKVPVEMMLVETDCPYLAPEPHRGKRNEPAFVEFVAKRIAELKGLSYNDVARITTLNAKKIFRIQDKQETKIIYPIRNSLYLNITNRCTNVCTFCAKFDDYTVKGHYLKLGEEPTSQEVLNEVLRSEPLKYDEIVFCGFGEPLIRLNVVKEVGLLLKKMGCKIRIDTDGIANLVHGKNVLPELMFVDVISVSMNAPNSEVYQKLVKTPFGDRAFPAILWFLKEAKKFIPKVAATVVAVPGLDIEACRRLAEDEIGVGFRVRDYNAVG